MTGRVQVQESSQQRRDCRFSERVYAAFEVGMKAFVGAGLE